MCKVETTYIKQLNEAKLINPNLNWSMTKGRNHFLAKLINLETNQIRTVSLPSTKGTSSYGRFSGKLINEGLRDLNLKRLILKVEMSISNAGLSHTW